MNDGRPFDAVVVGGGVMGCTTALHLARAGMRVAVFDRRGLCAGASGVNAGTLSMQHPPRPQLVPYALRGLELWKASRQWLGADVGFREKGGLVLAFTPREAEVLVAKMTERRDAGAPIRIVEPAEARRIEPGLSNRPVLASHCPRDGYTNASLTGFAFRAALRADGVVIRERTPINGITRGGDGFEVRFAEGAAVARRLVLAAGVWNPKLLAALGLGAPIGVRINQMIVTERMPVLFNAVMGVVAGNLSLKQADNGTVLIGGGWQGRGDPEAGGEEIIEANLVGNIRLAHYAVPALAGARVVRTWIGFRDNPPDHLPLVGPLPGIANAFLITCVRDGYTLGPFMGKVLADHILGREPERPIFDPARLVAPLQAAA